MVSLGVVAVLNPVIIWVCVTPLQLGFDGIALGVSLAKALQPVVLIVLIQTQGLHKGSWPGWSRAAFQGWGQFLSLGFPGFIMICAEW